MTYTVKEIFPTQQGEGINIGRTAIFIRFAGCNLWSGREDDRAKAVCKFCDTDFVGGQKFEAHDLASLASSMCVGISNRFCVLTGGEPLLQVDKFLIAALKSHGFLVAVETNGTQPLTVDVDWVCVSPKAGARLVLLASDELKLVYPQAGAMPERYDGFASDHRWLSPMDGPNLAKNIAQAAEHCRSHPEWRLAIQAHKHWNIP